MIFTWSAGQEFAFSESTAKLFVLNTTDDVKYLCATLLLSLKMEKQD